MTLQLNTRRQFRVRSGARGRSKWLPTLLCLILACLIAPNARAQSVPPVIVLTNGMRVLIRERHVSSLVALDLWVRAGAREEGREEAGSAHFLEHVLFKGTATRGVGQADVDVENLGGTLNAATGPDYARFYTTVTTAHASAALLVLADVICHATLPDAEVERERGVILDELAQHDSDPTARVVDLLYAGAYPHHAYHRSPIGSGEAIRLRGRDTLAAFYRRAYRPDRCTLVLVGDVTPAQARQWAEEAFGGWRVPAPASSASLPPSDSDTSRAGQNVPAVGGASTSLLAQAAASPAPIEVTGNASRAHVGIAFPAPPANDYADTAAALLAAEILGDARHAGRFAAGIAGDDAAAHYTPRRDSSLWMLLAASPDKTRRADGANRSEANTNPGSATERGGTAERALRQTLDRLRSAPPNSLELQNARLRLVGKLGTEQESNAGLAAAVGYADLSQGEPPETLIQHVLQTTATDVQRFLARYVLSRPGLTARLLPTGDNTTQNPPESHP